MFFCQKVILKNISPIDVVKSFHNRNFIQFLTIMQPIKINSWKGIEDGMQADFSFWFFGWKNMSVEHVNYDYGREHLYFEDIGVELPFGIDNWRHKHSIDFHHKGTIITDEVIFEHEDSIKEYLIYIIMYLSISLRKLTYRIWFYRINRKN